MDAAYSHKRKISFADLQATIRRPGPAYPHPQVQQPSPQQLQQQQHARELDKLRLLEAAQRSSKKPTDRDIPDELADVVVGEGVERYRKLRDVERRLDATMMRKRLDISDNLNRRYTRREGILRIWVSNTAEGQPWQVMEDGVVGFGDDGTFDFENTGQATYKVKIEGRLLDDPWDSKDSNEDDKPGDKTRRPRLSHFFRSITVDFDRNPALQPDGYAAIEWRKPQPNTPNYDPNASEVSFDSLEFERKSDENMNITINLARDEKQERFKLSPMLAEILDTEEDDRAGAVQGIWEYCRSAGLQTSEDKRDIICDDTLRRLFQKDRIAFPWVPDGLIPHLQPLPPVQLDYTIRVDKAYIDGTSADSSTSTSAIPPCQPTVYDVRVSLPNPLNPQITKFHTSKVHHADLRTINQTDDNLALLVQKIHESNARRKFYDNLSKDPASFVRRWTASQKRDIEVVLAEAGRGGGEDAAGEEFRKGGLEGVWGSDMARESVGLWLARSGKH